MIIKKSALLGFKNRPQDLGADPFPLKTNSIILAGSGGPISLDSERGSSLVNNSICQINRLTL